MNMLKKTGILVGAGLIALGIFHLGGPFSRLGSDSVSVVSTARAVVGRPLTPVSVAGVARRTARRCANGTYNC